MSKAGSRKVGEEPKDNVETVWTNWMSTHWPFICATDPERKQWRKSDITYVKYHAEKIASGLALHGPKWLDETVSPDPVDRDDELPEFASELGSREEWESSSWCISHLSSKLVELMRSTEKGEAFFSEMFETLGILAYVQARIAQVLETAG